MARYRYKAASSSGDVLEGEVEAASREAVVRGLQAQGHVPIRADEVVGPVPAHIGRRRWGTGIRAHEIRIFTTEFATLLGAGLAVDRALDLLAGLSHERAFAEVVRDLQSQVRQGIDLSSAMERHPKVFSRLYLNMVRAGEASGTLDLALARVAESLERAGALRESLVSALIYPVLLLGFAGVSIGVILGVVIPRISALFTGAGQELPALTRMVVQAGGFVHQWWWAMAGLLVAGSMALRVQLRRPAVRLAWDRRLLALPLVGRLIGKYEAAKFTRTLATLLQGGVPLLDAIPTARQVVGNRAISLKLERVADHVRQGQGLARPLLDAAVFPGLAAHLLQVGEEAGTLDTMLLKAAEMCDQDVQTSLKRAVDILGPLLILVLAVLIGALIMSVLVAVLGVNELAF